MARRRRRIRSKRCYEICFRARQGLPLVAYDFIRLILGSVVARTQRDDKVMLCHDIWNGSHCHMIIVALDSKKCTNFYGEVQKRITDAIKRLLGLEYLDLWEGNAMVAEIVDLDAAIDRITYLYANPAQDNLVEHISEFPGFSSWREYQQDTRNLHSRSEEFFPWIRLPSIPKIGALRISLEDDRRLTNQLKTTNQQLFPLSRHPNVWMKCFGLETETDVQTINSRILDNLLQREETLSTERKAAKKTVMGAQRLRSQPLMKPHVPKKRERKVFILCSINELRMQLIREFITFCDDCMACYQRWKDGRATGEWPIGAFRPPFPPDANLLPA